MKIGSFLWFFEKGPKYTAILAIALLAVLLLPGSFYIVLGVPRLPADWRQTFFVLFVLAFVTTALLPVIQLLAKPCIRKVERRKLIRSLRNLSRDEIEILQEHLAKNMKPRAPNLAWSLFGSRKEEYPSADPCSDQNAIRYLAGGE